MDRQKIKDSGEIKKAKYCPAQQSQAIANNEYYF
jgi:hypothetical protein